ncbi:glycoside hydrolase family 130 protein [Lacticaseibacillus absianus]|uniref:glycoside hydrolase family 130 protein n=1 Tax=Lacticaseibacillus absianus TaxID=2729623 RepID=UPI0015C77351|nr:glycoside hydrolase family 130 protein [Lacticaseibacillus absianus]
MHIKRFDLNPLVTPADVRPSRPDFEVVGAFNGAVAKFGDETIMLLRVAERPIQQPGQLLTPVYDAEKDTTEVVKLDPAAYDLSDSRVIRPKGENAEFAYLTSLSHIRCARSRDGQHFTVDDQPFIYPHDAYETFGIEDPRCTQIGDTYYINFSAVSKMGICVQLVSTKDFAHYQDEGIMFLPDNKDVAIFEGTASGRYWTLSRPTVPSTGVHDVWISASTNLHDWGGHRFLFTGSRDGWDNGRVGAGMPPFLTQAGWLEIYHAANKQNQYCLGAMLLDRDDPTKILARTAAPIMVPSAPYETDGFFGDVVFTCGGIVEGDRLTLYYGAADTRMAAAELSIQEILGALKVATDDE